MRIVYVVSRWGEPTQTFVRREAEAVATLGVETAAVSLKRPHESSTPTPTTHLHPHQVALGVVVALLRRPRRVAHVLVTVVRRASPRNLPSLLVAALVGVAWAGRGVVRDAHLHAHFGWVAGTAAWAAGRVSGCPYSIVLHAFELHTSARNDRFTPIPLRGASTVFAISEGDAEQIGARWGIDVQVLRMGVPREWLLDRPRVAIDDWHVVSVGSLYEKKGHDVLLRALAQADERWSLTVVGEGPEREGLESLARELGVAARVQLAGRQGEGEVRALLDRAAVFALTCTIARDGDRDGIPVSLMEAMARGVPVITSRVSAIPELVEGVGLLTEPGDVAAIASALDQLRDASVREELAAGALDRVRSTFLVEHSAVRVASLLDAGGDRVVEVPAKQVGDPLR
jgi:colanic acid/amylovoran biosynthesis glycosyltransferase